MAESYNSSRVVFPAGKQQLFLDRIEKYRSVKEMAKLCGCSERTIRDWRREHFSMSRDCLILLCNVTNTPVPKGVEILDSYWHVKEAARLGGKATAARGAPIGGDQEVRKQKWREWWEREGKLRADSITKSLPIHKPQHSRALAEFCGIMLGDGGLTKAQVRISLHREDDREYVLYVSELVFRLFGIVPSVLLNKDDAACDVCVSRVELVRYLQSHAQLLIGNKVAQQVDVPLWIKEKPSFRIACLRGLLDTDGCVFTHKYHVNGKQYTYKKISFTSKSKPLLVFFYETLVQLGMRPRYTKNRSGVRLESKKDTKRYFELVGSHNDKHLMRFDN